MEQTIRLYDEDAYATSFTATVLSCEPVKDRYAILLDQTLFFPEEGGQSPDTGTIENQEVMDVQIKEHQIFHYLTSPLDVGSSVTGQIDWSHRFSNMQQHTGEHLFSGLTHKLFGYDNVGFHLSDQVVTMDFNGELSAADIDMLEEKANQAIWENVPVSASYPSKEVLSALDYRSKIELEEAVRIVTIEGYDTCACCAPHLHHTGEIGLLKVMDARRYKGGMRLSILCGRRALMDYRDRQQQGQTISTMLSVPQTEIADAVEKLKTDLEQTKTELSSLKDAQIQQKLLSLPTGTTHACLFEEGLSQDTMRTAVNTLTPLHEGYCGIFCGNDSTGYRFIIGSTTKNCQDLATLLRERYQAKGGGKPEMIQGSVSASQKDLETLFQ